MARVLLVDDDGGVLETCGSILRHAGLDVETAARGRAALDVLARRRCDLLLIDLVLPDMSGIEVLAEARQRGSRLPTIVITGYPSLDTSVAALRLGAVDYLTKPVFGDALVAAVDKVFLGPASHGGTTPRSDRQSARQAAVDVNEDSAFTAASDITADGLVLWATAMRRLVRGPHDVASVTRWATLLRISPETLYRWCRTGRLRAGASLRLGRVLRALRCAREYGGTPDRFIAVSESRTLVRLLREGGVGSGPLPTIEEALARQSFVRDPVAIAALRWELGETPRSPRSS